jgi:hypothetical protein
MKEIINGITYYTPDVFEQYEYKGFLITIENSTNKDYDLYAFATPTKFAQLLDYGNYELADEILEANGHFIRNENFDFKKDEPEFKEGEIDYFVIDPTDETLMWFLGLNLKSVSCMLDAIIFEINTYFEWKPKTVVLKQITKKSITPKSSKKQRGFNQVAWSSMVKLRDEKCKKCGSVYDLHAHHIKSYKEHPELRYDVNNGITLCGVCHRLEHKLNGR